MYHLVHNPRPLVSTKNAVGLGALQRFALCDEFATYCRVSQESYWGDGIDIKIVSETNSAVRAGVVCGGMSVPN